MLYSSSFEVRVTFSHSPDLFEAYTMLLVADAILFKLKLLLHSLSERPSATL